MPVQADHRIGIDKRRKFDRYTRMRSLSARAMFDTTVIKRKGAVPILAYSTTVPSYFACRIRGWNPMPARIMARSSRIMPPFPRAGRPVPFPYTAIVTVPTAVSMPSPTV